MGGGGGGSITKTGLDAAIEPYVKFGLSEGERLYKSEGPQFFQGPTYVSPSEATQQALQMAKMRAVSGSPLVQAAQQQQLATIQNQGVNPYLPDALAAAYAPTVSAAQEATRGLQSTASRAGRYGSDAMAQIAQKQSEGLGRALGQSLNTLAYGSSEAQAQRAQQAAQLAPQMAQADYADIQALLKAGQGTEQYQQAQLQDEINRYNYEQNLPQMKLREFANLFSNVPGGTTTTTQQTGGK